MNDKITKYREVEALSYSKLSKFATHPGNLLKDEKKESISLDFGSLVDCIIFTPEDFDARFYIAKVKKPTGAMGDWVTAYLNYELPADYTLQDTDEIILKSREVCGYNKSLKDETALRKFHEECDDFLKELGYAGDRIIINNDDLTKAINYQSRLLTDEFTSKYFNDLANIEFQKDIYFTFEGCQFKSLLDGVIFNHELKTIQPFDLKTTSDSVLSFEGEFIKWKYYLQAGLYYTGLKINYPDYTILPFRFIVINDFEAPMVWEVNDELHQLCMYGGILRSGRKIKGIYQLIEEIKWHEKEGKYDYPASYYQSDGVKRIDIV